MSVPDRVYDECTISTEDVFEILLRPDAGSRHSLDEIGSSEEGDVNLFAYSASAVDALAGLINFLFEVVEDFGSGLVFFLLGFPGVDHQPVGGFVDSQLTHCYSKEMSAVE